MNFDTPLLPLSTPFALACPPSVAQLEGRSLRPFALYRYASFWFEEEDHSSSEGKANRPTGRREKRRTATSVLTGASGQTSKGRRNGENGMEEMEGRECMEGRGTLGLYSRYGGGTAKPEASSSTRPPWPCPGETRGTEKGQQTARECRGREGRRRTVGLGVATGCFFAFLRNSSNLPAGLTARNEQKSVSLRIW